MTTPSQPEPPRPPLRRVEMDVCADCLAAAGEECHQPGCAFWMRPVPTEELAELLYALVQAVEERERTQHEQEHQGHGGRAYWFL